MILLIHYNKLSSHREIIHKYEKTEALSTQNNTYILPNDGEYLDVTDSINEFKHCKVCFKTFFDKKNWVNINVIYQF